VWQKSYRYLPVNKNIHILAIPSPNAIEFELSTGEKVHPVCVTARPADENNEMNTCEDLYTT